MIYENNHPSVDPPDELLEQLAELALRGGKLEMPGVEVEVQLIKEEQ